MFILASNSPRRLELLEQAGVVIDKIICPNIEEIPFRSELPINFARRMAVAKSKVIKNHYNDFVLTADTIVTRGRRILGKPESRIAAKKYLRFLSGSRHRVATSVCLSYNGKIVVRDVTTIVKMKLLSDLEIEDYLDTGEWKGKAGGYAIQGQAAKFIPYISGSYTNVMGLPLTETLNLLIGNGFIMGNKLIKNE